MALNHLQKDLKLAINFADTIEQPLPLAAASNEMFKEAKRLGLGARDISAVYIKADYTSFRNGDLWDEAMLYDEDSWDFPDWYL